MHVNALSQLELISMYMKWNSTRKRSLMDFFFIRVCMYIAALLCPLTPFYQKSSSSPARVMSE